jgi:hypothetical protein
VSSLRIESQSLGSFTYRNWIISNDDGEIVVYDQDTKFVTRVLGLEPAEFVEDYMGGVGSAQDMETMEANILFGIEKRLEELDLSINDLVLYEGA